ncbi:MAG: preprotein translocase subunit SecA [Bacteroidia bacterium]|nr:preprotein translocase subunit SecA [Bacteroidia bacterium]MDW8345401.1 preprotein translocase subunit SecA [Bacteroidia bacterium]
MFKLLAKLFGSKKDKDIEALKPIVEQINQYYAQLHSLTDDELRDKTRVFKEKIQAHLADINAEINELQERIHVSYLEGTPLPTEEQEAIYEQIKKLNKEKDKQTEDILNQLLPEAFAVVKETARRFTENRQLVVKATEFDRKIAQKKSNVVIQGDTAIWHNKWIAAGNEVEWNMIHYDVQLMGGIVLHQGKIAEMATGEGKTLVSTLPVYLNALAGQGVHVVTVNDYLARRDAEWNGPIYEFHQLSVDCIDLHQPHSEGRIAAYRADITYGTNNEFGFDYLRDNMVTRYDELCQRGHHYAIIDEVDSILIDEARTPLIIAGPVPEGDKHQYFEYKPRVQRVYEAQKRLCNELLNEARKHLANKDEEKAGLALLRAFRGLPKSRPLIKFLGETGVKNLLNKTELYYLQDNAKNMPKVDEALYFVIDEKNNTVEMTDKGRELITNDTEDPNFFVLPDIGLEFANIENHPEWTEQQKREAKDKLTREYTEKADRIHTVNQLLKAYTLFEKDVEYIVENGQVKIVDEQTGRIMEGRRYSDGLHQAIEAKENVKVEGTTQTYATISLQNYFRMYHKLAGMTGTAETESVEFYDIYKLDVVVIPTHRPVIRKDLDDQLYRTKREKYNAIAQKVQELVAEGRPVLVGTTSVENSEVLSRLLRQRGIKHNVLNAKLHQKEAEIVAQAGQAGVVTIATNMAGRGTDIKLGPGVKEKGGLAIIGTERHESRRIDRQLRGRSGRQGDPGSSQFYVSLEDDLMRLFASDRLIRGLDRIGGVKEGEVIQHSMITKSIERAQKKVEEQNFAIRKRLIEYDNVMNQQREVIYTRRRNALKGQKIKLDIQDAIYNFCSSLIINEKEETTAIYQEADINSLQYELYRIVGYDGDITQEDLRILKPDEVIEKLYENVYQYYQNKTKEIAEFVYPFLEDIYKKHREKIKTVVFPFSTSKQQIYAEVDLQDAYQSKGLEVMTALERSTTLAIIDDKWKDHLREMDDLRQSVQNVTYEQKDPLLIYKFEAFQEFQKVVTQINQEILEYLFHATLTPILPEEQEHAAELQAKQQARKSKQNLSKLKTVHQTIQTGYTSSSTHEMEGDVQYEEMENTKPKVVQRVVGNKIQPNQSVDVQYLDGTVRKSVKYKKVQQDIETGRCIITKIH